MAYHNVNLYAPRIGRPPSSRQTGYEHISPTMSSTRLATNGMSYLHNSPDDYRGTNTNMSFIRSPDNFFPEDGATPLVISPHDTDFNNMLSQAPYAEEPRAELILNGTPHLYAPDRPLSFGMRYPPPWNAMNTISDYRATAVESSDEMPDLLRDGSRCLAVPDNIRSRGGTRRSFSTVQTPYTASSDGRNDLIQERTETRRGGRQPGSRLPEAGLENVRQVRNAGACIRCRMLKMRCSGATPCETCNGLQMERKWARCLRSFDHMADLLKPDILAERLQFLSMRDWVFQHTYYPPNSQVFELPLHFGFGETFYGLSAVEYNPIFVEAQHSHAVSHDDQLRIDPGIPVCPIYDDSKDAQRMIWHWMKETLTCRRSIDDWLEKCFPGDRVEWIRELLLSTWKYSIKCWDESRRVQIQEPELDNNLLEAWMAALLVGMLSLSVTIPEQAVRDIIPRLRFGNYNYAFANTSRVLNKAIKSLLFDMYQEFVHRLTSALHDFGTKPEEVSERRLGHIHCIAILVIVLNCQIQTSLMDNGRLSSVPQVDPNLWEVTYEHMRGTECAFRNTIMFVRHNNNRWLKKNVISDGKFFDLREDIRNIERTYHADIRKHHNVDLERLMTSDGHFHERNMQRVFAFFFDLVHKEKSNPTE